MSEPLPPAAADVTTRIVRSRPARLVLLSLPLSLLLALAGCAGLGRSEAPAKSTPAALLTTPAPDAWQAPVPPASLPHQGQSASLAQWWQQLGDPLLVQLQNAAQSASPDLSAARLRLEQARTALVAANASLLPQVQASASIARGRQQLGGATGWLAQAGPQASWEWDWAGGQAAGREAAGQRVAGAAALWHDARISVAADTASTYLQLRACEAQVRQTEQDTRSREETARLTGLAEQAGFQAPSTAALARASAGQGRALLSAQRSQCASIVKALVALTGLPEPGLRRSLAERTGVLPGSSPGLTPPWAPPLAPVPATALGQRPDVRAAIADWQAAQAEIGQADAARWPRVSLSGQFLAQRVRSGDVSASGNTWSIGPLSVTLPVFDGGVSRAQAGLARVRADNAEAQLKARLRTAVREVEDALLQLDSTAERAQDAQLAAEGFEASFKATEARQRAGLASLFELEDARRTAVAASSALIDLQRERTAAWILLYRALGGGWQDTDPVPATLSPPPLPNPFR